jgi:phage tail-like protein
MPDPDKLKEPPFFPVAFSFRVDVAGIEGGHEGSFQEVSGISVKLNSESLPEGGENRFEHRLPTPPKYENLVLKRGMILNSDLIKWARKAVEEFKISTKDIVVKLIDENGSPLASWSFVNAYPVALKVSEFKAQDNAIVIETLELSYSYFTRLS